MIPWTTVEDALATWVIASGGLQASWARQRAPRPALSFVSMSMGNMRRFGQDFVQTSEVPNAVSGKEIHFAARGVRSATLTLTAYDGGPTGITRPDAILESIMLGAALPSVRATLDVAGVAVASFGPILAIDGLVGMSDFEPRAILAVELHLTSEVSEFSTYIEHVEIENELTSNIIEVDL